MAAVYAAFIALFVYRDMGPLREVAWRRPSEGFAEAALRNVYLTVTRFPSALVHEDTQKVMTNSAKTTIMLMFIIANALLFAHVLTTERIPQQITDLMLGAGFNWVHVPDCRQCFVADRWSIYGTVRAVADCCSCGLPDRGGVGG